MALSILEHTVGRSKILRWSRLSVVDAPLYYCSSLQCQKLRIVESWKVTNVLVSPVGICDLPVASETCRSTSSRTSTFDDSPKRRLQHLMFKGMLTIRRSFMVSVVPRVLVSESPSPFFNMGVEEHLFRMTQRPTLFLWRNAPVVFIGKHQNVWSEVNVNVMEKNNIVLARRTSGGGAVYQDLGNTCFTFVCGMWLVRQAVCVSC